MSNPLVDLEKLVSEAEQFDYIRFSICDLNGIARGKIIPSRNAANFIRNGLALWSGSIALGPASELPIGITSDAEITRNLLATPVCDTVANMPWAGEGNFRVGEILCEPIWYNGSFQDSNPRYVARKQLNNLQEMGFKPYSSYEVEFFLLDDKTKETITKVEQQYSLLEFSRDAKLFFGMERDLQSYGVDIQSMECETEPGQYEFALQAMYGITPADMLFKLKNAMKEICFQKGYHVTFMSQPFPRHHVNGLHYNISLWDVNSNKNAFYDAEKEDGLSDTARYFIGGILAHAKALTAILCPTSNCYRRINHSGVTPKKIAWGIDNRFALIRAKNEGEKGTYIENRLPSGLCNPYLALASTIAAGIDGIRNKTEPAAKLIGTQYLTEHEDLPQNLPEALAALEEDPVITEAMGKEFTQWFVFCKKLYDVKKFGNHDVKKNVAEEVEAEKQQYYHAM